MINQYEPIPSPEQLLKRLPATLKQQQFIESCKKEISFLLKPESTKRLLILGPCSLHDTTEAIEYATKLKQLQRQISSFLLVMRVHFEKPRSCLGWKGFLYDPFLDGSENFCLGLNQTRQLLLQLAEMHIPAASELLDPSIPHYFQDLLSWGCIGARTTSSQIHRQLASSIPLPVGFKNTAEGNIQAAIQGALFASKPHSFFGVSPSGILSKISSLGNRDSHVVLRGGTNQSNFDPLSIAYTVDQMKKAQLSPKLIVDCSHGNSQKNIKTQARVFQSVVKQCAEGNPFIRGMMLESYLEEGKQPFPKPGCQPVAKLSLTDPCLSWKETENLVLSADQLLNQGRNFLKLLLICLFFFTSCSSKYLSVTNEYINQDSLASSHVGTPDPLLYHPPLGQRLTIDWSLPQKPGPSFLKPPVDHFLLVQLCFGNAQRDCFKIPLTQKQGSYRYTLLNQDFFNLNGIVSYQVQILEKETPLETWRHPFWIDWVYEPE